MNFQIIEIATALGREFKVKPAHVAAIIEVESNGIFDPCQIRFEGHYFYERLKEPARGRAMKAGLADPKMGAVKNPASQDRRYAMLDRACAIDERAAIESTSWGVGQVMGTHWKALGFASAQALRLEALSGLEGQARLMMRYVRTFGLLDELQSGQWAAFARGYNGPAYRKFSYDTKMAAAAKRNGGIVPSVDGMLRLGSQGKRVRELQTLLVRAGCSVKVDGDFGLSTKAAVVEMQQALGLTVDGIVGPDTFASIAAYRTSPDEKIGKRRLADMPHVGKIGAAVLGAGGLSEWKDQLEGAASQVGDFAGKLALVPSISAYAETAASALVAVAAVVGVAALAYGAWQWWQAGTTYEGVRSCSPGPTPTGTPRGRSYQA